ncbi:MAG: DUF2252 family protein [Polyangia bacterium]
MSAFSAPAWAARQREIDRARIGDESLLAHKAERMSGSPLALLRGAAPLFYELCATWPELAAGPAATGWMVGDLHIENFGAYRPSALTVADDTDAGRVVFDINDFDDATVGPVHLDLLRLTTSLLLGTRDLGIDGKDRAALGRALLSAWAQALVQDQPLAPPDCVHVLLDRVGRRDRRALLDGRTELVGKHRRFPRGARYRDLPPSIGGAVVPAFAAYARSLPDDERPSDAALEVLDCAFRVAGTGSLGALRVAVLTRGKGGPDGAFIFDLKAQGEPSSNALFAGPALSPVARVRTAAQALLGQPPRMLGETTLEGRACLGRRLAPQEDRLDWTQVHGHELTTLVAHFGTLAGRAHRRGLKHAAPVIPADLETILGNAMTLAGMHEAIYLGLS